MITLTSLFENTATTHARAAEDADELAFYDRVTPILPAPRIGKSIPVVGQVAYAYSMKPGTAESVDSNTNTVAVHGRWHRLNEWSSEPWTAQDRLAFDAEALKRSQLSQDNDKATQRAYAQRRALRKQFTGR
jgi:hypothetical protein